MFISLSHSLTHDEFCYPNIISLHVNTEKVEFVQVYNLVTRQQTHWKLWEGVEVPPFANLVPPTSRSSRSQGELDQMR